MARKPLTKEDVSRGERMKRLRERFSMTQEQVYPGNHTQVINVEKGKNAMTGAALLARYGRSFGVSSDTISAYAAGAIDLEELERVSSKRPGGPYPANPARGAALPVREKLLFPDRLDTQSMVERAAAMLERLDGVKLPRALVLLHGVNLEEPTADGYYEAARIKLAAESGGVEQETIVSGEIGQPGRKRVRR